MIIENLKHTYFGKRMKFITLDDKLVFPLIEDDSTSDNFYVNCLFEDLYFSHWEIFEINYDEHLNAITVKITSTMKDIEKEFYLQGYEVNFGGQK